MCWLSLNFLILILTYPYRSLHFTSLPGGLGVLLLRLERLSNLSRLPQLNLRAREVWCGLVWSDVDSPRGWAWSGRVGRR